MKIHRLADLFPLMAGTEFDGLVEKIRAHGLRDPIKTWNAMLLDGQSAARLRDRRHHTAVSRIGIGG